MSVTDSSSSTESSKTSEKIKRPLNAFILWSKKRRRVIANENPQMHNFDISRKLGLEWQKLSEEEKTNYFEEAKKLKEEHKQLYPDYKYQPRKRDKTNKRSKLLHGAPYQFSFYPAHADTAGFFDPRFHFPLAESRPSFPPDNLLSPADFPATSEEMQQNAAHGGAAQVRPTHSDHNSHSAVICQSFRQSGCDAGFVPYRSLDAPFMPLRPNFDISHLNWYSSTSSPTGRVAPVPYCSRIYPWHSAR
ncbi:transcription factor SOX-14-like [Acropora palmata]|uniref:transcription factor SOX-14-like n=1 Tax=Acropora palmata TaxID=6131 RepID=UPI003DA16F9C